MHSKIKYASCLLGILLLAGCSDSNRSDLKKAEWILGLWENRTERGSVYEKWERRNPLEFSGKSYMLRKGDTVVFETIRLVEKDGNLIYIPTVANQNESMPVRFRATRVTEIELAFENREHEFPQEISYIRLSNDSLVAKIRGMKNGAEEERLFPMSRAK